MKKLLILAYDFPPYVSVGGLRPYSWYKYLKDSGVEPIVVTRNWTNEHGNAMDYISASPTKETVVEKTDWGTLIKTPYKPTLNNRLFLKYGESKYRLFRRLLTAYKEIMQFIYITGPKKNLYIAAKDYLKKNNVDAIIATGDPFVLFFYAKKLGAKYKIPWIADYRDPWSHDKGFQQNRFYYIWNKYLELRIVSKSKSILTVSDFVSSKLLEYFPKKTISIISNGYDSEIVERISNVPQSATQLTISFVGTIYEWHPWKSFISVFSEMVESQNLSIRLNMYGINISEEVLKYLSTFPPKTQESIHLSPRISNEELLNKLANENVMLLFNNYSFMGTKIFDYIGARRKIILCYQNDRGAEMLRKEFYSIEENEGFSKQLQADLISETSSGIVVENEEHLKRVLSELVIEFNQKGRIDCNSKGVENYSRKIQAKKLAEIIKYLQ